MGQVYALYKSKKRERADRRRLVFFFLTNCWHFCQKFLRIRSHGYSESYAFSDIYWVGLNHYFSRFMFSANPDCCMQVFHKPISKKTNRKRIKYLFTFWDRRYHTTGRILIPTGASIVAGISDRNYALIMSSQRLPAKNKLSVKRMLYLGSALQVISSCAGTCLALIWLVTSQCDVVIGTWNSAYEKGTSQQLLSSIEIMNNLFFSVKFSRVV